jgi:hypothetical protein
MKPKKPYDKMTAAELRQATREYDEELPLGSDGLPGRPLNAAQRRQWQQVKKKLGRPRLGKGVKRVLVSIEADLLRQSDRFAKKHGLTRSKMISAGLRKLIAG